MKNWVNISLLPLCITTVQTTFLLWVNLIKPNHILRSPWRFDANCWMSIWTLQSRYSTLGWCIRRGGISSRQLLTFLSSSAAISRAWTKQEHAGEGAGGQSQGSSTVKLLRHLWNLKQFNTIWPQKQEVVCLKTQIIRLFFRLTLPEGMDILDIILFFYFIRRGSLTPFTVYCGNGPFAEYAGHMVQKTPCRMGNNAKGKKNKEMTSFKKLMSFLFNVSLLRCHSARCCFFVTFDRIPQRAYYHHQRKPHTCKVNTILGSFQYDCLKTLLVLYTCV